MSRPRKPPMKVQDLQGFRYLRHFQELWQPLRACARDRAGNRTFFYDPYVSLLLRTPPNGQPEVLLLCTDRLDRDAALVALGYQYRGWIELFFCWLKCILGCRQLLSTAPGGLTIQIYVALIASLLSSLCTGRKPSKRTFEMLCFFFAGWATVEEMQRHLEHLAQKEENSS